MVIALTVIGGFGAVAYLAAWLLLPDTDGRILLREAAHGSGTGIALVVLLVVVVLTGLTTRDSTWFGGWMVPVAVLLLFLVLRSSRSAGPPASTDVGMPMPPAGMAAPSATAQPYGPNPARTEAGDGRYAVPPLPVPPVPVYAARAPQPPRPQRRRAPNGTGAVVLGLSVIAYGIGHLLDGPLAFPGSANLLGLLLALGVAATAALALGLSGRRGGLASVLTLLLILPTAGALTAHRVDLLRSEAVTWSPTSPTAVRQLGAGTLTVDLGQITSTVDPAGAAGGTTATAASLAARVGTGEIVVLVPAGTELTVHAVVGIGEFRVGSLTATDGTGGAVGVQTGNNADGFGINRTTTVTRPSTDGSPLRHVSLDANVGVGSITLQEK
jgi:hypothetical protein